MIASDLPTRESARLQRQRELDESRTAADRNRLGQFATPAALAREMAIYLRELWGGHPNAVRFLDPAVGTGAFFSALLAAFAQWEVRAATGIELDPEIASVARALWSDQGLAVVTGDFTTQSPPIAEERYDLVIANPPYVRHHHLSKAEKARLRSAARSILGRDMSGLAGLYCHFMVLAHPWMAEGGLAAWLVPSEFMDVNYGSALKYYLTHCVRLLRIHQFDPAASLFNDALVSSTVVVFSRSGPDPQEGVSLTFGGTLSRPEHCATVLASELSRTAKWTKWLRAHRHNANRRTGEDSPPLSSLFRIKRGIATGANNFFILPRARAIELGMGEAFLKPILPSPRHLRETIVEADDSGYPLIQPQLALIDTDLAAEPLSTECPGLLAYLLEGEGRGLRTRYLLQRRDPWYRQEQRPPAPFMCTYMGRTATRDNPFRFIWNRSRAIATNVYLLLYPTGALSRAIAQRPETPGEVWSFLQSIAHGDLLQEGRVYGGGLYKLEPAELGRISAAPLVEQLGLPSRPLDLQRTLPLL